MECDFCWAEQQMAETEEEAREVMVLPATHEVLENESALMVCDRHMALVYDRTNVPAMPISFKI